MKIKIRLNRIEGGTERVVEKFIWFPKKLPIHRKGNCEELRWLGKCRIRQFYGYSFPAWINWKWEDE
jgi:hypothetical protein